jgi:hypothetical protein
MVVLAQGADLQRHIDSLSAFDYATRTTAARMLRRAQAAEVVPALAAAARGHADQFVRYRALVLLTSFNARETPDLVRSLLTDRNDRVREVVYRWYERHPNPEFRTTLIAALETEQADFVRPALVRAIAALPPDELVQRTLVAEVGRGFDFFRSAVIEALGERGAAYAVEAIAAVAALDGPLQDDAVLALGRIGGEAGSKALAALASVEQVSPGADAARRAAQCLLGKECASQIDWLAGAAENAAGRPEASRAAVGALAAVAQEYPTARLVMLRLGTTPGGRLREEAAMALSSVALRRQDDTVAWLAAISEEERTLAIDLLREGFERLEEDFAEEQFFAAARAAYWQAEEGSTARGVTATLIDRLEF